MMKSFTREITLPPARVSTKRLLVVSLSLTISALSTGVQAQPDEPVLEEVVVTGSIRSSLASAINQKRNSDNLVEVIMAEDIGKLPDQNLAEVLENVTGVQITREAGVGTGVQIRGTNANRTEINGVSTVGSGAGRSGINFEDVSAGIIAGVEVTKAPEAKTIEGSVGGTINLRTIRPLDLDEQLVSVRIQGEDSSLSTDGIKPRLSGTWGDNWDTDFGTIGAVVSASYAEQDVTAFRPRADRDNFVLSDSGVASAQSFDYLPPQFFVQDYDNYETETKNYAGSFEWAPNDYVKVYFDAVINDAERNQESSRVQASGLSDLKDVAVPSAFETVNFGSLEGSNGNQRLGSIQAAVRGIVPITGDGGDPNLRFSSDTNSRETTSEIFRLGTDLNYDRMSGRVEVSTSGSDSETPSFNTTLNFINPNVATNDSNENGTPFIYDLTGGSLTFGIAQDAAGGPTTAQLLDPANYVLRDVNIGQDKTENTEDAFRADFSYDLEDIVPYVTSVDVGYRYSQTTSKRDEIGENVGLRSLAESPRGNLFANILTPGPDNFDDADGRSLFIRDFLLIDPELSSGSALAALNAAILANDPNADPISSPTSSVAAFYDITEDTNSLYAQVNFEYGIVRGNVGLRYVDTKVTSDAIADLNGVSTPTSEKSDYSFVLPRLNLVADVMESVSVRAGWGKDIRRPDFDDLSSAFTFETSPNPAVDLGNPGLEPEEVESFDISAEWYFAPASVVSIGFFHKTREGVHVRNDEDPVSDPVTGFRDLTPPCEGGGIFNPIADINVFGPNVGTGVCVPSSQTINGNGETKQKGIEFAFQYDLADFEEQLAWASGFGFLFNYTWQEFEGADEFLEAQSRAATIFERTSGLTSVDYRQPLEDLSENAYNATVYYEKFGISARLRYTWREAYRSADFGSTQSFPWGFQVVQEDRGQLNGSIVYDITDNFNIGLEAVNLTEEEVTQSCVNEGSLLCFQGLTDRRITLGLSYRM